MQALTLPLLLAGVLSGPAQAGAGGSDAPLRAAGGIEEGWVEVEGVRVRTRCTPGRVEVILLHDAGADAEAWTPVLRRLDGRVGACAYDRPAHGARGAASSGRGWFELLDQLSDVHRAVGARRPILVGHGLGGLYARLHAVDRPASVGGLVLLEPVSEGVLEAMRPGMPRHVWEDRMEARRRPNRDGVRLAALLGRAEGRPLPDRPVTVVTATRRPDGDGWGARWLAEAARRHHADLARGVRLGRHLPAPAGHDLPREVPDLVAEEILRAVGLQER
jgi:pimeloyl-ACP methyl ester carboxylesterase